MKKTAKHAEQRRRKSGAVQTRAIKWGLLIVVVGLIGYGVSSMDGIVYGERDLKAVNFSDLSPTGKKNGAESGQRGPVHVRLWNDARAVRVHRHDLSGSRRQPRSDPDDGAQRDVTNAK